MTILNFVQPDDHTACFFVDTNNTFGGQSSKVLAIPHLKAVLGGRGRVLATVSIFNELLACNTFDEAFEKVDDIFRRTITAIVQVDKSAPAAWRRFLEVVDGLYEKKEPGQELLLAGWSESAKCVRAVALEARGAGEGAQITVRRDIGAWAMCKQVLDEFDAGIPTDERARVLVQKQIADLHARRPIAAACGLPGHGGRLIAATVSHAEITIRDLGELEAITSACPPSAGSFATSPRSAAPGVK